MHPTPCAPTLQPHIHSAHRTLPDRDQAAERRLPLLTPTVPLGGHKARPPQPGPTPDLVDGVDSMHSASAVDVNGDAEWPSAGDVETGLQGQSFALKSKVSVSVLDAYRRS